MPTQTQEVPLEVALFFVQQLPCTHQQVILSWLQQNTIPAPQQSSKLPLKFGAGSHLVEHMSDDFNEPLEDFKDYM